jgi:hypothetical protein
MAERKDKNNMEKGNPHLPIIPIFFRGKNVGHLHS